MFLSNLNMYCILLLLLSNSCNINCIWHRHIASGLHYCFMSRVQHELSCFCPHYYSPSSWIMTTNRCTVDFKILYICKRGERAFQQLHHFLATNNYPMFCSKSVSTMNTSLTRVRLSIKNLENHLIQAKVLKELNGFLLWAQKKDFMLER